MRKKSRKIRNSSGRAKCEICSKPTILNDHHIRGRDIPNPDHPDNIGPICGSCHDEVHAGLVIIEKWVQTTRGRELFWHKKGEESFTGDDAVPYLRYKQQKP